MTRRLTVADGAIVVGALLLAVGLALWSAPLALVVCGALLLAGGVYAMVRGK